jgi:predicted aspartyl protease
MKVRFRYDGAYDPPAPVVPVLVSTPGGGRQIATTALLDTGADCTLLPVEIVRALTLPQVDWLRIEAAGGAPLRAPVYAAELVAGQRRSLARVVAFGREPLLGRDWLNRLRVTLDGPALTLSLQAPTGKARRRR